jgi:hypothetical protein
LLSAIDEATALPSDSEEGRNDSTAAELIALVRASGALFFDTQADKGFVSVDIRGHIHTLGIGTRAFVEWLSFNYYSVTKTGEHTGKSASEAAIKQASFALAGIARYEGQQQRVVIRVADI